MGTTATIARPLRLAGLKTAARTIVLLALGEGDAPPTEFRLFVSGWNDSENGRYLFDEEAAKGVMSAYGAHEVDRMIDLEHLSLDTESNSFDPDARGWCKLELREDGSLWAVDVTWTPDGATRLAEKRQRYISPAFEVDPKTKRITKIINIALTALPATHGTPELVAARAPTRACADRRTLSTGPSIYDVQRAVQASVSELYPAPTNGECSGPWVVDVFDETAVYEYDGKLFEVAYVYDGTTATLGKPVEVQRSYEPVAQETLSQDTAHANTLAALSAGGEGMDPKLVQEALDALASGDNDKAAELLKGIIAAAASGGMPAPAEADPPAEELADESAEEDTEEEPSEEQAAVMAATSRLVRLTGKSTIGAAVEEVETWRKSHLELTSATAKLAKEREALELEQRKKNAITLTKLGAETPFTTGLGHKPPKLCRRLVDEPLKEQNDRVAALLAARGGKVPAEPKPPTGHGADGTDTADGGREFTTTHGQITLSARELKACEQKKLDPAKYAETRASIRARSTVNVKGAA